MKFSFANKSVLVTGAGSWLGREMALKFAKLNAHVYIFGRDLGKLEETKQLIKNGEHKIKPVQVDINDSIQLQEAISKIDSLDIVIANAAIYPSCTTEDGCEGTWQEVLHTNLTSVYNLMRYCIPLLKKSNSGRAVLISSIAGEFSWNSPFGCIRGIKSRIEWTNAFTCCRTCVS